MTSAARAPTPDELLELGAPECAVLWALEQLLAAARVSVEVANPELLDERSRALVIDESLPRLWAAEDIVRLSRDLAASITRYRRALYVAEPSLPDLPF